MRTGQRFAKIANKKTGFVKKMTDYIISDSAFFGGFSTSKKRKLHDIETPCNTLDQRQFDRLVAWIRENWNQLSTRDKQILKVQHKVSISEKNHTIEVKRQDAPREKSMTQEEELQYWIDHAETKNYISIEKTLRRLMKNLVYDYLDYDVSRIDFSECGIPHDQQITKITPITADNVIFITVPDETEIINGKYVKMSSQINTLSSFFKAFDLPVYVKCLGLSMDTKMTYGKTQAIANVKYKVTTCDTDLSTLLSILHDPSHMNMLKQNGILYHNIDIKVDLACTVTPLIKKHIVGLLQKELQCDFELERRLEYFENPTIVSLNSTCQTYRAKFYNKFSETITSPGVGKNVGDHIALWVKSTSSVMESAIMNPKTLSQGYSRVEVTWRNNEPPKLENVENIMNKFVKGFYEYCNYTPLSKQWEMLQPTNTVCAYDIKSTSFIFGRFKDSLAKTVSGFTGKAPTVMNLIHRLKLCSFHNAPVKLIVLDSDTKSQDGKDIFAAFHLTQGVSNNRAMIRKNHKIREVQLYRAGPYDRTHFLLHNHLYSSFKTDKNLAERGLVDTSFIKPSIMQRRIHPKSKLLDVQLTLKTQEKTQKRQKRIKEVLEGVPADGEYMFQHVTSETRKIGNTTAEVKCVHLTNGSCYLLGGQWYKWKKLMELNQPFSFYVLEGKLQLNRKDSEPKTNPSKLLNLPENQEFIVARVFTKVHYKKTKVAVVLKDYPNISFFATDELVEMLEQGYLKFKTKGVTYDKNRHKIRHIVVCHP